MRTTLGFITLGWVFGAVWAALTNGGPLTGGAPLTLFARALGLSPWQFGLMAAAPFVASLISLPASLLIEWTGRRKAIFLIGLYFQRFLCFPLVLVPLWLIGTGHGAAKWAVGVFLALNLLMYCGNAVGGPAWVSWMADVVPRRLRGVYFSRRRQWGVLTAAPAAILVGWLLDHYVLPGGHWAILIGCATIFMASAVCGVADIAAFQFVPDAPKPRRSGRELLRAMAEPLRDRPFLRVCGFVGVMTFAVSSMSQFIMLYLIEKVGASTIDTQLMLLATPMLAQFVLLPAWGGAIDTIGRKPVFMLAGLGLAPIGLGWVLLEPSNAWWLGFLLAAASTALWTGIDLANFDAQLEKSGANYAAVNSVIINLCGCIGSLSAGFVAQALQHWSWQPMSGAKTFSYFDVLFALTAVVRLGAVLVFVPGMAGPSGATALHALRHLIDHVVGLAGRLAQRVWPAEQPEPAVSE